MIAGFQGNVEGCPSCRFSGIMDGIDFGVGGSRFPVIAAADDDALFYHHCTDHGVGRSKTPAFFGQIQRHLHKMFVCIQWFSFLAPPYFDLLRRLLSSDTKSLTSLNSR